MPGLLPRYSLNLQASLPSLICTDRTCQCLLCIQGKCFQINIWTDAAHWASGENTGICPVLLLPGQASWGIQWIPTACWGLAPGVPGHRTFHPFPHGASISLANLSILKYPLCAQPLYKCSFFGPHSSPWRLVLTLSPFYR